MFSTYAVPKISDEIRCFLRDGGTINVSRTLKEQAAETATASTGSIQRETGENGFTLEDVLSNEGEEERMLERLAVREAIARLPEREQMVINLRYFHGLTQDKIAKIIVVSQVKISRLKKCEPQHLHEFL